MLAKCKTMQKHMCQDLGLGNAEADSWGSIRALQGLHRGRNLGDFLDVYWTVYSIWVFIVYYWLKIANFLFGMDCHIFLDMSGTFQIFTKYGPFHPLFITKMIDNKNQENSLNDFKHILFLHISTFWISQMLSFFEKTGTGKWWRSV